MDDGTDTRPHPEIRRPWSRSDRPIPRRIVRPLQEFLNTSTASGTLLLVAAFIALAWANSPWGETYESFWRTTVAFRVGGFGITEDLRHWVNDGLMALFFLVVGLEVKREFLVGELKEWRAAALPVIAAIGGMIVPALLYLAINAGGPGAPGWGIPMATDIAFALGVLMLAARHAPAGLKPFILTLAIVDDIGAILVIALFYSEGVSLVSLAGAAAICLAMLGLRAVGVRSTAIFVVLGVLLWLATNASGVHPTIAGVVLGFLAPSEPFQRPEPVSDEARRTADMTEDDPTTPDDDAAHWLRLSALTREAVSPLARTEHALLPLTSFAIVPVFALANAGVRLTGDALSEAVTSPITVGIVVGLVVGKVVGISGASALALARGVARLPTGVGPRHLVGAGTVAGIGFTVSLFIADLAFDDPRLIAQAKVGILAASVIAGVVGWLLLRAAGSSDDTDDGPPPSV
jgi:NhaA family Na+:H+ antiporter